MTLFNLNPDMARQIYDAALSAGAGFTLTLTVVREGAIDPNDRLAGRAKTETAHTGYGLVETTERRIGGTIVPLDTAIVSIYGASLPAGVIPEVNDKVEIQGETYCIAQVGTDPAKAMYICNTQ